MEDNFLYHEMDPELPSLHPLNNTNHQEEENMGIKDSRGSSPPDRFFYTYGLLLLLGLTSLMASTYIFSANDFWMFKFRNSSIPWHGASDVENRTYLQKSAFSFIGIATAIPSLLALALIFVIMKRTATRTRITASYITITAIFVMFFLLALANTDTWQIGLLAITMILAAINSAVFMILIASIITLIANFPPAYVKAFTLGQGSSAIVTSLIQIFCLAIGNESRSTGLIYFGIAILIYLLALVTYIYSRRFRFYTYHIDESRDTNNKHNQKIKPVLAVFKLALSEVWPLIAVHACCIIGQSMDNVGALVVSQYSGDGTEWTEKYFVPVITLLLGNVLGLVGRLLATNVIRPSNCYFMVGINIFRTIIFLPLYIGCNAYPRKLPVWFPYDWQYIIVMGVFAITNGYFTTSALLSLPNFTSNKVQKEIYYLLLQITLSIVGFGSAPLNILVVSYIL